MMAKILVTGGTGTLGRLVVARLAAEGSDIRVLSRQERENAPGIEYVKGDLATGEGADEAVVGIETIIHCAGSGRGDEVKTKNLVQAASKAGTRHLVFISVVGADRAKFSYFTSKLEAERIIEASGIPWTTLRATQFHDFILMIVKFLAKMPVMPVPTGARFQPVDAGEVAERMVELAQGAPAGLVPDMAGPRVYTLKEMVRQYLQAAHKRRLTMPLPLFGKGARSLKEGANLALDRALGRRTWEEFLAERFAPANEPQSSVTVGS